MEESKYRTVTVEHMTIDQNAIKGIKTKLFVID